MTGQGAREDEREALVEHLRTEARRLARLVQPCGVPGCRFMVRRGDGGWSHLDTHGARTDHPAIGCLDAAADALAWRSRGYESAEARVFDVIWAYDNEPPELEATYRTRKAAQADIRRRLAALTTTIYFGGWEIHERRMPVGEVES